MKTILVSGGDINSSTCHLIKGLFSHWGYKILWVENIEDALVALSEYEIALFILILQTPRSDKLKRILKQSKVQDPKRPVIVTSTVTLNKAAVAKLECAGADAVLYKPYDSMNKFQFLVNVLAGTPTLGDVWFLIKKAEEGVFKCPPTMFKDYAKRVRALNEPLCRELGIQPNGEIFTVPEKTPLGPESRRELGKLASWLCQKKVPLFYNELVTT